MLLLLDDFECVGGGYFKKNRKNSYPMAYWLNDAESPTQIEAYFRQDYYFDSDARLSITEYNIEEAGKSIFPRSSIFETNENSRIAWVQKNNANIFRGLFVTAIDKNRWISIVGMQKFLESLKYTRKDKIAGFKMLDRSSMPVSIWKSLVGHNSETYRPGVVCRRWRVINTDNKYCRSIKNTYGLDVNFNNEYELNYLKPNKFISMGLANKEEIFVNDNSFGIIKRGALYNINIFGKKITHKNLSEDYFLYFPIEEIFVSIKLHTINWYTFESWN